MNEPEEMAEARRKLAELLGMPDSVSDDVVRAALDNPLYAHHLVTSGGAPEFLQSLLDNPPVSLGEAAMISDDCDGITLASRALKAIWKWGKSGFAIVDVMIYNQRISACEICPHLKDLPNNPMYFLIGSYRGGLETKICGICGCVASKKARLPSETCPDKDPSRQNFNRWGEPVDYPS